MLGERCQNLAGVGDYASHAAEMADRNTTFHCQADIFYHLAGVELYGENTFHLLCKLCDTCRRERPEGDGADKTYFHTFFAGFLNGLEAYAGYGAERHDKVFGILGIIFLIASSFF